MWTWKEANCKNCVNRLRKKHILTDTGMGMRGLLMVRTKIYLGLYFKVENQIFVQHHNSLRSLFKLVKYNITCIFPKDFLNK